MRSSLGKLAKIWIGGYTYANLGSGEIPIMGGGKSHICYLYTHRLTILSPPSKRGVGGGGGWLELSLYTRPPLHIPPPIVYLTANPISTSTRETALGSMSVWILVNFRTRILNISGLNPFSFKCFFYFFLISESIVIQNYQFSKYAQINSLHRKVSNSIHSCLFSCPTEFSSKIRAISTMVIDTKKWIH